MSKISRKLNRIRIRLGKSPKYEDGQFRPGHPYVGNPDTLLKRGTPRTREIARMGGLAVKGIKKPPRSEEHQRKLNEAVQRTKNTPRWRFLHREAMVRWWNDSQRLADRSKLSLKLWQDPEYVAKQIQARNRTTPNKAELLLVSILDKHFPKQWEFVGDGALVVGGLCPDFASTNGKRFLIDLFGSYWHTSDEVEARIAHFRKFGYGLLVIWDKELANEESVCRRVGAFTTEVNRKR